MKLQYSLRHGQHQLADTTPPRASPDYLAPTTSHSYSAQSSPLHCRTSPRHCLTDITLVVLSHPSLYHARWCSPGMPRSRHLYITSQLSHRDNLKNRSTPLIKSQKPLPWQQTIQEVTFLLTKLIGGCLENVLCVFTRVVCS